LARLLWAGQGDAGVAVMLKSDPATHDQAEDGDRQHRLRSR